MTIFGSQNGTILETIFWYNFEAIFGPVLVQIWAPFWVQKLTSFESIFEAIFEAAFKQCWPHPGLHFGAILAHETDAKRKVGISKSLVLPRENQRFRDWAAFPTQEIEEKVGSRKSHFSDRFGSSFGRDLGAQSGPEID